MKRFAVLMLMVVMATCGLADDAQATDRAAFVVEGVDVSDFVLRGAVVSPRLVLRDVSPRLVLLPAATPRLVLLSAVASLALPRVAVFRSLAFGRRAVRVRPRLVLRAVVRPRRCR